MICLVFVSQGWVATRWIPGGVGVYMGFLLMAPRLHALGKARGYVTISEFIHDRYLPPSGAPWVSVDMAADVTNAETWVPDAVWRVHVVVRLVKAVGWQAAGACLQAELVTGCSSCHVDVTQQKL